MKSKYPKIKVISKPMKWKSDVCAQVTQTVLSTSKIDGIFMGSESVCLAGVQAVMKAQKKLTKVGSKGHIISVGIDGSPASLKAVRAGTLDAVISQPLDLYANYGISYIKDAMAGKVPVVGPNAHGGTIVALPNGSFSDLLPSPTITKANASDPALWGNG
jgi:simple sugar transport system substrate-binding protein/ribose transport system substrate-binding protein